MWRSIRLRKHIDAGIHEYRTLPHDKKPASGVETEQNNRIRMHCYLLDLFPGLHSAAAIPRTRLRSRGLTHQLHIQLPRSVSHKQTKHHDYVYSRLLHPHDHHTDCLRAHVVQFAQQHRLFGHKR